MDAILEVARQYDLLVVEDACQAQGGEYQSAQGGWRRAGCQDYIKKMHAAPGDSGSPIFRWHGNTVTLAGILWGGISEGGTQYIIMSAMWNIEKDIGALSTF